MAEFFSRRDVDFLLYEWLDVVQLTKRDHFAEHSRDTFDAVIDLSADRSITASKVSRECSAKWSRLVSWTTSSHS